MRCMASRLWVVFAILVCGVGLRVAWTAPEDVHGSVAYVAADAVYIDVGSENGLQPGDLGTVLRSGREIATIEVVSTTKRQARVRMLKQDEAPVAGDRVILKVRRSAPEPDPLEGEPRPGPEVPKEFEPLLQRQLRMAEIEEPRNLFHGRVAITQLVRVDGHGSDYATTLLSTNGSLDRIDGTPWAFRWGGTFSYRAGEAFSGSALEGGRADVYDFQFRRRLGEDGVFQVGRFVPRAMASAGYFDGLGAEVSVGDWLRVGGAAGLKPTRDDLALSADEPTGLLYLTHATGDDQEVQVSGTLGLLGSAYDGSFDRLAVLVEEFVTSGDLRANATAEIDFDVDNRAFRDGIRLTRLDAYASWAINQPVTVRVGIDHHERLDTGAERAAFGAVDASLYKDGFWRYWAGLRLSLPGRVQLDAEVGAIEGRHGYRTTNWRATLSHSDMLGLRGSTTSLTVYNLEGLDGDGIGGILEGFVPLTGGKLYVRPGLGFRNFRQSERPFEVTDLHLHLDYNVSEAWELRAGATYLTGVALDSLLIEVGAAFRW